MKKRILILVSALFLLLTLASCEFVRYIPYETPDEALEARRQQLIEEIKSLSDADFYDSETAFTFEILLNDAVNELSEQIDIEALKTVFEKHKAVIEALPRNFEKMIEALKNDLHTYVKVTDYRESEQLALAALIETYTEKLSSVGSIDAAEALFRAFKADVYYLKTDSDYKADEFATMKEEAAHTVLSLLNYADYRKDEQKTVAETVADYTERIKEAKDEAALNALVAEAKATLQAIPTADFLYQQEQTELCEDWLDTVEEAIEDYGLLKSFDREALKTALLAKETKEASAKAAAEYLMSLAEDHADAFDLYRDMTAEALKNSYTPDHYRELSRVEMASAVNEARDRIEDSDTVEAVKAVYEASLEALSAFRTNDALWEAEDETFLTALTERYGKAILTLPASLTEAYDYTSLAAIIDYYAFYQTDYDSFLRDTFRVKINFPHKDAQYEINEVYWYCELIRSAVGITGYFEEDGNHLVIKLIPYAIATKSNTASPKKPNRYVNLTTLFPDKTYTPRSEDYNGFGYLQNETALSGIWNTQQLWYALEQGYLPITVEGSPAEKALRRAEEILRKIISDEMTIEEKAFAIYRWFGENVTYDSEYSKFLYPEDREHFPDSLAATLNSFHVEGALFENYAVCCSFAKAYLLLLRVEGIEAYRIMVHKYTENAIDNLGNGGYGSHAFVALKGSDGKFYYSDTEQCYLLTDGRFPKYHQFLQIIDHRTPYEGAFSRYYNDLDFANRLPTTMLEDLTYRGYSINVTDAEHLDAMLDLFAEEDTRSVLSLFESTLTATSIEAALQDDPRFDYRVFAYNGFSEYLVFRK